MKPLSYKESGCELLIPP